MITESTRPDRGQCAGRKDSLSFDCISRLPFTTLRKSAATVSMEAMEKGVNVSNQ